MLGDVGETRRRRADDAGLPAMRRPRPAAAAAYDDAMTRPPERSEHGSDAAAQPRPSYLAPYERAVADFGASFEATLWASREKQLGRFEVMADMVDFTGRIVLDAGCGLGDFASWMERRGVAYGRFIGLEAMPSMVDAAAERGLPDAIFERSDFVADPTAFSSRIVDIVVFSGSLNTLSAAEATPVLRRAWEAAREAVVFNFLSARNHEPNPIDTSPAQRWEPTDLLAFALDLTPRARFRQDYFDGHDGTIAMLKRR
jgi:SAM-dependent methyltransferase